MTHLYEAQSPHSNFIIMLVSKQYFKYILNRIQLYEARSPLSNHVFLLNSINKGYSKVMGFKILSFLILNLYNVFYRLWVLQLALILNFINKRLFYTKANRLVLVKYLFPINNYFEFMGLLLMKLKWILFNLKFEIPIIFSHFYI